MKKDDISNKKIQRAELRIYEGKEDGINHYIPVTKVFVIEKNNIYFDVLSGSTYNVCDEENMSKLQKGDVFCEVEKPLEKSVSIFNYMVDSEDFFYHRLPYLQERFQLYSKSSSFLLPLLIKYKRKIREDEENIKRCMYLLNNHCIKLKLYSDSEDKKEKNKLYQIDTNHK